MVDDIKHVEEAHFSKIVLVTGVSKGLGRALALEFAKCGHTIIGCARNQNQLDLLQAELSNINSLLPHLLFNIDVRSNDSVKEMACTVMDKIGAPDIIVNNAAIVNENSKFWEIPKAEFDDVIDINIKGTANVLRHFIPLLIPKNESLIINMSSIYGRIGAAKVSPYCCSKWGIEGLSKSIAKEAPNGMAVVALDPGVINTHILATHLGHNLASQYQSPKDWALNAASIIVDITSADNGASMTIDDLGIIAYNNINS